MPSPPATTRPRPRHAITATARHGAHVLGTTGRVRFSLWAPTAAAVEVVIDDTDAVGMTQRPDGWWDHEADAGHGTRYAYRLDGAAPLPDPAARWLPDGVHEAAAVLDVARLAAARLHDAVQPPPVTAGVIYELHIGTFTAEGTFGAAHAHLPALAELGVTHVEVMPVNAFDGAFGWGYDGVAWWAVHEPYGGPEALNLFVDACHAAGLGVILDVVHNHLGPSGAYLPRFGPYLQADAESTWGRVVNLDGPGSGPVREFVVGNALSWLADYAVDGLRLDAVHALDDRNSAVHILGEMADAAATLTERTGRRAALIAETDRNDPSWVRSGAIGGLGLDAQWADDLHHAIHVAVTGETDGYYVDYADAVACLAAAYTGGFVHDGSRHSVFRDRVVGAPLPPDVSSRQLIACVQNHDQVGNRPTGDRLTTQVGAQENRVAIALLCAAPHTPMLFMGEEHGETNPFRFFSDMPGDDLRRAIREGRRAEFAYFTSWGGEVPDPLDPETLAASRVDHDRAATPEGAARRRLWTDLLALRRHEPALSTGNRRLVEAHADGRVLWVRRHPPASAPMAATVTLVANLSDEEVDTPAGTVLLSTADRRYGGAHDTQAGRVPPMTAVLVREDPR